MTPANAERSKAARIRKRARAGRPVSAADRVWLAAYEKRTKPKTVRGRNSEQVAADARARGEATPEQRSARTFAEQSVPVHTTEPPPTERVDPNAHTWVPRIPEGGEAPLPGEPPPPPPGTPVVASAPQVPSEAGAQQLAAFACFLTGLAIQSAAELATEWHLPAAIAGLVHDEELARKWLLLVHGAATRCAYKYNVQGVPYADEAVVLGSSALGVVLTVMAARKRFAKPRVPQQAPEAEARQAEMAPEPPKPSMRKWWPRAADPVASPQPQPNGDSTVPVVGSTDGLMGVNRLWAMPREAQ